MSLPGFIRKVKLGFFPIKSITKDISHNKSCFKHERLYPQNQLKIGLFYDIKFIFANNVDKKLKIFIFIFHLVFFIPLKYLYSKCSTRPYLHNKEIIIEFPSIFKKLYLKLYRLFALLWTKFSIALKLDIYENESKENNIFMLCFMWGFQIFHSNSREWRESLRNLEKILNYKKLQFHQAFVNKWF